MNLRRVQISPWLDKTGLAALYTYAFTTLLSTAAATVALWVLVGLYGIKAPETGFRRAHRLFLPWAVLLAYLLMRTLAAMIHRPEWAAQHVDGLWKWARLLLFPVVAWWIQGDEKRVRYLLATALAGLLFGTVHMIDLHTLESAWQGMRTGFHLRIIAFGLYAGTFVWGLVCFAPEVFHARRFRALWVTIWAVVLLFLGQCLFFTQSRGVFLGFALTSFLVSIIVFMAGRTQGSLEPLSALKRGLIAFWALFIAFTVINRPLVEKRWLEEKETLLQLKTFDFSQPAHDSTGHRAHLYRFAWESICEDPLWGAGPATSKRFIQESGRETLKAPNWKGQMQWWDHLHSTHLEILFHFGTVGALLWLWLYSSLIFGIHRSWKCGTLSTSLWLFSLASLIYLFLWALFDFRALHPDWRFFWNFLAGVLASKPFFQGSAVDRKETRP